MLGLIRIVLGFMLVWAFFDKLFGLGMPSGSDVAIINGGSPTEYYLSELIHGPLEGMWGALAGNVVVDILLMFGLITVGTCLMVGIASKLSTIGFVVMMIMMYCLCIPPADNPIFDYHIIYILAELSVYFLGGFSVMGVGGRWKELKIVKRYSVLE